MCRPNQEFIPCSQCCWRWESAIRYTRKTFQPPKPPAPGKWSEEAPRRESLEFQTTDGLKLRGWLYRSDKPDAPFVLFFFGSNEDLGHEANRLAWLSGSLHVNAVCFDYPGYGFSGGAIGVAAIQSAALSFKENWMMWFPSARGERFLAHLQRRTSDSSKCRARIIMTFN
jgi:hypothetical protein